MYCFVFNLKLKIYIKICVPFFMFPDIRKELEYIYDRFSKKEGFPKNYCQTICVVLERFGLHYQEGWFLLDHLMPDASDRKWRYIVEDHKWCKSHSGEIVDLTAPQFNDGLDQKIEDGVMIITPGTPLFQRYIGEIKNLERYRKDN